MNLAIAMKFEEGLTWSIGVEDGLSPQEIADLLAGHNANGQPDEILLIVNGPDGPYVTEHFGRGNEYD